MKGSIGTPNTIDAPKKKVQSPPLHVFSIKLFVVQQILNEVFSNEITKNTAFFVFKVSFISEHAFYSTNFQFVRLMIHLFYSYVQLIFYVASVVFGSLLHSCTDHICMVTRLCVCVDEFAATVDS